jgi:hypothetical protein
MTTLRNLKIKTSTCKRIVKELRSYEKEVEKEAAKTADMKEKGADPYDLKQQVLTGPLILRAFFYHYFFSVTELTHSALVIAKHTKVPFGLYICNVIGNG